MIICVGFCQLIGPDLYKNFPKKMLQRERKPAFLCTRDYYISLTVLMIIIGIFVLPSNNMKTDFELCIWGP